MKKILVLSLCLLLCAGVFGAFAGGGSEGAASAQAKKISLNQTSSAEHPWQKASVAWAEQVEKGTQGRYSVQVYPNATLAQGNYQVMMEMVQAGTIQVGVESLTVLAAYNQDVSILNEPFLFQNVEHTAKFLASDVPVWKKWMGQFAKNNLVILAGAPRPMRQLNNNVRMIKSPADMDGMKFRVPANQFYVSIFEALGAKPVPMPSSEIYSSIQLGTVNGEDNSVQTQYDFKTHEVAKFFTVINYIADASFLFMNKDFFDAATAEDQKVFTEAGKTFAATNVREDTAYYNVAMDAMKKTGVQFYEVPDADKKAFKDKLAGFYKDLQAKYSPEDWKAFHDAVAAAAK
ncbi:MAG: TRAP transporter substrate-binding protein [Spirochaetales bacterium]|jgi:tripartite ATP-independent transporter DctP family solute receptor|nr:TRAP transporter substrate-binding protein [Spirochaetales bacterium]